MTEYPNHNNFTSQLYSMQVLDKQKRIPVYVTPEVHKQIVSLRTGSKTYGDVIAESIALSLSFSAVSELLPNKFTELNAIGRYPLLKPMKFTATYSDDDKMWFVENDEFSIIGGGNSEAEIVQSLEDHFEGYVVSHPDVNPDRFSAGSVKLHKKLEEYVDFNQASEIYSSKYNEA